MYAATIDGENPKIDGKKLPKKSVAKRQRTIERQKHEEAEEARERAAREFGEATIAPSDPSLKEEADMSSLAKGKGWDPLDAPPPPEDQDDDDSTGGGGPLDDLPSGKGWDY
ncbi:hypothetical protein [Bradyrhizobium sp. Leaf401]|uniref:hypothetical protein n=1 Tax=Bradyrhizobium sp. Leaf401 TaxID=2876564 RepID=UPI001E3EE866|nr:hypothetical protein [Bradyrhizobium sp. Leaf401]